MSITVIRPGALTTLQDLGRRGHQRHGVPETGAMDETAHRVANLLLGNPETAVTLEITLQGPVLEFSQDTLIAITGGDFAVTAGGAALPLWRPVLVRGGARMEFGECRAGCRAALAVHGGFAVKPVLGSRSTYLGGHWGGIDGRVLRPGDRLVLNADAAPLPYPELSRELTMNTGSFAATHWSAAHMAPTAHEAIATIRVTPGQHWESFSPDAQEKFLHESYAISLQSDRMGCRLEGPALKRTLEGELLSEAVAFGTIQVPPDGQPIILLADRQTIGGYPKIAQVSAVDRSRLVQRRPREKVRFTLITLAESQRLWLEREHGLRTLQQSLKTRISP